MILEMDYEQIQKNFGKKWAWRLKEVITTLGHKEDEALEFIGKIPDYADIASRLRFVSALNLRLGGGEVNVEAFASFGGNNPENPF